MIVALADDLTGALEVGAQFTAHGVPSRVTISAAVSKEFLNVFDMESRHLAPDLAERIVTSLTPASARLVYLKTDSTLRGNIAAGMRALSRVFPDSPIAYVPAYPELGRTVRDGRLFVDGIPVHEAGFANDPLNPVRDSSIADLLGRDLPCVIHDGETTDDVADAVTAALADSRCRIIAGPASVAAALAARIGTSRQSTFQPPSIRSCLIVNGSLHETSARQITYAEANCPKWQVLKPPIHPSTTPLEIAAETAQTVIRRCESHTVDAIMIFGGDTAYGILKELGCAWLEPLGEVIPGVPVSRVPGRKLHLITKAGGFGDESLVCRIQQILHATN